MDDIKEPVKSTDQKKPLGLAELLRSEKKSFIRTMEKDLAALQKKGPVKPTDSVGGLAGKEPTKGKLPEKMERPSPAGPAGKAVPPTGLPVAEPAQEASSAQPKPAPSGPAQPAGPAKSTERLRKEEEIKKRIEETRKRIEQSRRKAELARQKAVQGEKAGKEEKKKEERGRKKVEKKLAAAQKPGIAEKKLISKKLVLVGLAILVVVGGSGGFVYWWNYLRTVEPVFHYECQDNLCQQLEGEGEDQCQTDADCQPVELAEPDSLIPIAETKTIELTIGREDLLVENLETITGQTQATSTFKRILVKSVSQAEERYADLSVLLTAMGVSLPESILTAAADSQTGGDNYTLFLYNQAEGNRLGLVIKMGQSETLVEDLKNWEATMVDDLRALFLKEEVPAAFTEEFQDNIYQDIAIRYLNFPDPGLSIDYGIVNGKLVLTTSRASMYAAIEALSAAESEPKGETEIDTSNWRTYRNEEYGFELKYPQDWTIQDNYNQLPHDVIDQSYILKSVNFIPPDGKNILIFGVRRKGEEGLFKFSTGRSVNDLVSSDAAKIGNLDVVACYYVSYNYEFNDDGDAIPVKAFFSGVSYEGRTCPDQKEDNAISYGEYDIFAKIRVGELQNFDTADINDISNAIDSTPPYHFGNINLILSTFKFIE